MMKFLLCTLSVAVLAGCGSEAAVFDARPFDVSPEPPDPRVIMEFVGDVDVLAGTMTIRPISSSTSANQAQQALAELPVGNGPTASTVDLSNVGMPAPVVNGCGGNINSFEGDVALQSFFMQQLANVYVEITAVAPTGFEGCRDEDATQGLSSQFGLFRYGHVAASGSSTARWRFATPSGDNFSFVGRVMGEQCAGPCDEAFVDATAACPGLGTRTNPFCSVTNALAQASVTSVVVAGGTYAPASIGGRTVQLLGGRASVTFGPGGGVTTIESAANNIPGITVLSGGVVTLDKLRVISSATSGGSFVDGIFVASGGQLLLRNSSVRGGTSDFSGNTDGVRVAGVAVIERSVLQGGVNNGTGGEDNASALHIDVSGRATVTDSTLSGAVSANGFSYGVLSFGRAELARNVIDGGVATAGLFSLGIRSKTGSILRAASNRISGGTNFRNSYGLWNSGDAVVVGNTIDGGEPVPNGTSCTGASGCSPGICKFSAGNTTTGTCARGRGTAVQLDGGDLALVNNVLSGGGSAATGFPCVTTQDCGALGFCASGECRAGGGAFALEATEEAAVPIAVSTFRNAITDGVRVNMLNNADDVNISLFGPSDIILARNHMNACRPPCSNGNSGNNIAVDGMNVILGADGRHTLSTSAVVGTGIDPIAIMQLNPLRLVDVAFERDIDGALRPLGGAWDIGADEQ